MALPHVLNPRVESLETALRGVVEAVDAARHDRRTDEPDSGLRVGAARKGVNDAMWKFQAASEGLEAALDTALEYQPEVESEIRSAQSALSKLHLAVSTEVALTVPLEGLDPNLKIAAVTGWPTDQRARLEEAAFGPPGDRNAGLMTLLRVGTDDDPKPEKPGQVNGDAVGHAIRVIRRQAAEPIIGVFVGLTAVPLMDAIPLPLDTTAVDVIRGLLEEPPSWAVEEAVKELPRGASKWARWALGKATQLLIKVLGPDRLAIEELDKLLAKGTAKNGTELVAAALVWAYDTGDVIERGEAAYNAAPAAQRNKRGTRLRKLEESNKRWLGPIKLLAPGVGHLWAVPIPLPVPPHVLPAAPAAAAVLLAWTLILSGDQLDSRYPYPNLWKGVVRRAGGE